jgi:KipI family sensor histidine kinase inhibitor
VVRREFVHGSLTPIPMEGFYMPNCKVLVAGDTALVVDFGDRVDLQVSAKVLSLARRLNELRIVGVNEMVPTIRSLSIYYEPISLSTVALQERVLELMQDLQTSEISGRTWQLPVCYDAALAPDLSDVADHSGLSRSQVIELHSGVTYHVYMLGFLPGLAYLGDVPDELALPRRENPRPRIPAGSVGIAANMTCVYPMDTPCGWHLVGRSPVPLWDLSRETGALLAAGDKVKFKPLSLREYERGLSRARSAVRQVHPAIENAV